MSLQEYIIDAPEAKKVSINMDNIDVFGLADIPKRISGLNDGEIGWKDNKSKFIILKLINNLITKSKQIENDISLQNYNQIHPLETQIKQQQKLFSQLELKEKKLDEEIENSRKKLFETNLKRDEFLRKYQKDLTELEMRVNDLAQ